MPSSPAAGSHHTLSHHSSVSELINSEKDTTGKPIKQAGKKTLTAEHLKDR